MKEGLIAAGIVIGVFGWLLLWIPLIGLALVGIGFILFVVGLVSPSQQQQQIPQPPPRTLEVLAICPECKNRISSDSNFCPICGTDLRPKK